MSLSLFGRGTRVKDGGQPATGKVSPLGQRCRAVLTSFFTEKKLNELLDVLVQETTDAIRVPNAKTIEYDATQKRKYLLDALSTRLRTRLKVLESIDTRVHNHPIFTGYDRSIGDNTESILKILQEFLENLERERSQLEPLIMPELEKRLRERFATPARKSGLFAQKALTHLSAWEQQPKDEKLSGSLAQELDALVQELNTPGSQLELRYA